MVTNLVFGSKSTLLYYSFSDVFFSCLYESFVSTGVLFLCNKHANPSINNIKQELASKMKWNENEMKSISHYILASEYNAYILKNICIQPVFISVILHWQLCYSMGLSLTVKNWLKWSPVCAFWMLIFRGFRLQGRKKDREWIS